MPGVSTLLMGPGDLSIETGISLLDGEDVFTDGFVYARSKVVLAAKAYGQQPVDAVFTAVSANRRSIPELDLPRLARVARCGSDLI